MRPQSGLVSPDLVELSGAGMGHSELPGEPVEPAADGHGFAGPSVRHPPDGVGNELHLWAPNADTRGLVQPPTRGQNQTTHQELEA